MPSSPGLYRLVFSCGLIRRRSGGRTRMKRLLLSSAIALAISSAIAADIPVKARQQLRAPAFTWSGFYAGINAGFGVSRSSTVDSLDFAVPAAGVSTTPYRNSFVQSNIGALVGVQAGYNFQLSPYFVAGVEADWQWSSQGSTACAFNCGRPQVGYFNLGGGGDTTILADQQHLRWLATLRARAGKTDGPTLWYATGGIALGELRDTLNYSSTFIPGPPNPLPPSGLASFTHHRLGWTIGGGMESQLWDRVSAKIEYLYVDLGHVNDQFVINQPLFGIPALPSATTITKSYHFSDHVIRAGLNYRFNGHSIPPGHGAYAQSISSTPPDRWGGLYAGLNAGLGISRAPTTDTLDFAVQAANISATPYRNSFAQSSTGAIVGAQVGYNFTRSPLLVTGIEADWQWSSQRATACAFSCAPSVSTGYFNLGGAGDNSQLTDKQELRWLATLRGRLGVPRAGTLWYATGGAALAELRDTLTYTSSFIPGPPNPLPTFGNASFTRYRFGWTIGGGAETQVWDRISAKIEYLYVDLGHVNDQFVINQPLFGIPTLPSATTITKSYHFTDHIVRAGLNYHFN